MGDLIGLIVLIIIGIVSSNNKKKKNAQKKQQAANAPVKGNAAELAAMFSESARAQREAQFDKDMQVIREKAKKKLAAQKAAEGVSAVPRTPAAPGPTVVQTTMLPPRPESSVVNHDELHAHAPSVQSRVPKDAPAPLEPMEGVDPCHDTLYDAQEAESNAYEMETDVPESDGAAQELLRGIILSEVLTRPTGRWRTQHR